ncbi:phage major capsid protein [Erythrobacter sp. A6_0]|uniref:phage major capsid protein n=1 Tax=Erythrobacter sp. A6_0 TaxID=2821089 RepID=UPI001AD9C0F7|nr:phage major capsid protein [Erythrobacter sp. A6_0]MBO9510924.1 phage major capsid protein [Erythrobacter sp. A6_0]
MNTIPRAISHGFSMGAVMAAAPDAQNRSEAEIFVRSLADRFDEFKATHNSRLDEIGAAVDALGLRSATEALGSNSVGGPPTDPEYSRTFASYFRSGASDVESALREANATGDRQTIQAAMSVGSNSDGGYIAPVEWDRNIRAKLRDISPMRSIAQVQETSTGAFTTLWNDDSWGSGWVGETAARPETTGAKLSQLTFESGEIYAMPAATQRLLDDASINVENWLASSIETEFARQEGVAFISGNGVNKPRGLLTYVEGGLSAGIHPGGDLATIDSGAAEDIPNADALITFKYGLAAPYRQNARWLMNSQTAAAIAKMKDGDGNFVWREGLIENEPATLLGRPVTIDESMPNIAAGNLPIAFGDFNAGYLINDRIGTRVLRDPFTNKPFVLFYTTKRVGGGVLDPNAIILMKIAAAA